VSDEGYPVEIVETQAGDLRLWDMVSEGEWVIGIHWDLMRWTGLIEYGSPVIDDEIDGTNLWQMEHRRSETVAWGTKMKVARGIPPNIAYYYLTDLDRWKRVHPGPFRGIDENRKAGE